MILVTGVGVRASIGRDRESFAAALMAGRTAFTRTGGHWSTALLDHAPPDAPPGHPNAAKALARATPAAALSCAVVLEAWTHARLDTAPLAPDRIGIVLAGHNLTDGYLDRTRDHYERDPRHQDARFALRRYDTDHLGTVSELLGLRGPGHSVGAASASGNLAVMAAANLIATGAADACLVVGPAVEPTDRELHGYHNVGALAADEPCRPFDAGTTGFTPGRAAAALVLESAASATRRSAPAMAHLAGHHSGLDATSGPEPNPGGAAETIRRAVDRAGGARAAQADRNPHRPR
jgi:malonyl-ACP decarboxylase